MSPTTALSEFIADCTFEDLPAPVVAAAKVAIMDGLAVTVAGSVLELSGIIGRYVQDLGGNPHASVVGWGFKTSAPSAAFANGVFGHALDYEIQGAPPTHGTSSCLPAALALGERGGVSGKDIILAYTIGWEVQGRLRAASAHATNPAYHPPGLVGPLGGAAAAASVLGLDAAQTQMALSIAASRTGGLTANTGTMVKSTHPGNAARMGTEAGMLAAAGYTGTEHILEAPRGYAEALFGGDMRWETVTDGLGSTYRLIDPGYHIKRFPAQIHMQNPTEAVLELRSEHAFDPARVRSLELRTDSRGHSGSLPRSGLDGKFSLEYCAAAALLDGAVTIETFTDERRFAPDMETLLPRVQVQGATEGTDTTTATATLDDGTRISATCQSYTGSMTRPMGRELHLAKVTNCLHQAMGAEQGAALIGMLDQLESIEDVGTLMSALARQG